jgi:hypothetical protein
LRRIVPSFTVEVRHRPKLATNSSQGVQALGTKSRPTVERESHRVAAATFEAKTSNPPSSDGASSYPKRRILESLVPDKPPGGRLQDELLSAETSNPKSRARTPPMVRTRKDKERTSTAPRNSEASSDLKAQMGERTSVASNQPTGMSASDLTAGSSGTPTLTANPVVGNSGGPAPRPKAKRRVPIPIALDARRAAVSAKDERSITRTDSLGTLKTRVEDVSRPNKSKANYHGALCLRR